MGLDEGLSTLPCLLVDVGRTFVFVHPIVVDVGFRSEVKVLVADGSNQFVESLVFVAFLFVKLKQRNVDIRVVGIEFLDFLVGL